MQYLLQHPSDKINTYVKDEHRVLKLIIHIHILHTNLKTQGGKKAIKNYVCQVLHI